MKFALLGNPVSHSKSPRMHKAAYDALHLPHSYEAIAAEDAEIPSLVQKLRDGTYDGFNVTIPHKRRVLEYVDFIDRSASLVGAANTLVRDAQGRIVAHNTDVAALAQELAELKPSLAPGASGLVLGTGGAARSAVAALALELGLRRILLRGRRAPEAVAKDLAEMIRAVSADVQIVPQPLTASVDDDTHVCVVVQATSAGMSGADAGDSIAEALAWSSLPNSAVLLDVVYTPAVTPFLARAHAEKLRAVNGLGMLARQGALAFELWLKRPAPLHVMLLAIQ